MPELHQELDLRIIGPLQFIERGDFVCQNRYSQTVIRQVNLFRITVGSASELIMMVPGSVMQISKIVETALAHKKMF